MAPALLAEWQRGMQDVPQAAFQSVTERTEILSINKLSASGTRLRVKL